MHNGHNGHNGKQTTTDDNRRQQTTTDDTTRHREHGTHDNTQGKTRIHTKQNTHKLQPLRQVPQDTSPASHFSSQHPYRHECHSVPVFHSPVSCAISMESSNKSCGVYGQLTTSVHWQTVNNDLQNLPPAALGKPRSRSLTNTLIPTLPLASRQMRDAGLSTATLPSLLPKTSTYKDHQTPCLCLARPFPLPLNSSFSSSSSSSVPPVHRFVLAGWWRCAPAVRIAGFSGSSVPAILEVCSLFFTVFASAYFCYCMPSTSLKVPQFCYLFLMCLQSGLCCSPH